MNTSSLQDINTSWQEIMKTVKKLDYNNQQKVDAFLPLLKPQAISENFLMLTANNGFIKFWVESHISKLIQDALYQLYGRDFIVQIEVDQTQGSTPQIHKNNNSFEEQTIKQENPNNNQVYPQETNNNYNANIQYQEPKNKDVYQQKNQQKAYVAANLVNFDPMTVFKEKETHDNNFQNTVNQNSNLSTLLTFENFVIGNSNNIAYQMARAVAENPGKKINLNPLFIYGNSGVGKTHLLRAIQNYIAEKSPETKTIYVDANEFLTEYVDASTANEVDKSSFQNFRKKYENTQVLLIDDVQRLQGKKETLDMFFNIFNNMTNQGKQVVISADRAPKNIEIDERYQSRFNNGMTCQITFPEIETKLGIIKSFINDFKTEDPDIENYLEEDVKDYIAQNSSSNIRELKSAITKILYDIEINKRVITIDVAKQLLDEHFSKSKEKRINIDSIQKTVETYYGISHSALVGKKKDRNITYARQIAIYLSQKLLNMTTSAIGRAFNRDHSTVIHSINKIEKKKKNNRDTQEEIETLEKMILER